MRFVFSLHLAVEHAETPSMNLSYMNLPGSPALAILLTSLLFVNLGNPPPTPSKFAKSQFSVFS